MPQPQLKSDLSISLEILLDCIMISVASTLLLYLGCCDKNLISWRINNFFSDKDDSASGEGLFLLHRHHLLLLCCHLWKALVSSGISLKKRPTYYCMHIYMCLWCNLCSSMCHGPHIETSGQLAGVGSFYHFGRRDCTQTVWRLSEPLYLLRWVIGPQWAWFLFNVYYSLTLVLGSWSFEEWACHGAWDRGQHLAHGWQALTQTNQDKEGEDPH